MINYETYPIEPEKRYYANIKTGKLYHPRGRFLYPQQHGKCFYCGKILLGRRKSYCSDKCYKKYWLNFSWTGLRLLILERDKYKCVLCKSPDYLEIDHIVAVVNGGDYFDKDNLRTLCETCHKGKTKADLILNKLKTKKLTVLSQYL
ncbi:MAG: HNH endonuclease [Thermodesulfobacteriota bacterium]